MVIVVNFMRTREFNHCERTSILSDVELEQANIVIHTAQFLRQVLYDYSTKMTNSQPLTQSYKNRFRKKMKKRNALANQLMYICITHGK